MSGFYDPFKALPGLLVAMGALVPVTLTRMNAGAFDPKALGGTPGTVTTIEGHGVLSTRKTVNQDGEVIVSTTAKLTVAPIIGDKLTLNGQTFDITGVSVIAPDGEGIMWEAFIS